MKILEPGKPIAKTPPWWLDLGVRCHRCNCLFQLEDGDKVEVRMERHPSAIPSGTANCPSCDAPNSFEQS